MQSPASLPCGHADDIPIEPRASVLEKAERRYARAGAAPRSLGRKSPHQTGGERSTTFCSGTDGAREVSLSLAPKANQPYSPELNPAENIWASLRANKLASTFYEGYDEIVDKACEAWLFFANDKERVASIATREWAKVNV